VEGLAAALDVAAGFCGGCGVGFDRTAELDRAVAVLAHLPVEDQEG
jgi:hypothetical protein